MDEATNGNVTIVSFVTRISQIVEISWMFDVHQTTNAGLSKI
ncbi:hypothetical protein [uncultured Umboniibacter sp.]|nr:hypothetical protein [uncultured Umboniibacter sp.]